ncbi:helix-turn-helix transcriptional regulator [Chloroflexia bacterium SDU3-3]|nr:helix-turn-helix transcriptional regulator [Chloroflexia bacterium SDU3-3]
MPNYSFGELLNIFFVLQQDPSIPADQRKTQRDLAHETGIALRTLSNWFNDAAIPRYPEDVRKLAYALALTPLQADMLLYSVNPAWVLYGTPIERLQAAEVVRYNEQRIAAQPLAQQLAPSLIQIRQEWQPILTESFTHNANRWGVGKKQDGTCTIDRSISDGTYQLSLQSHFHGGVFMGGDSHCIAPPTYYAQVDALRVAGDTDEEGYTFVFEEIHDGCHAMMRIREPKQLVSVVQTLDGGDNFIIHMDRTAAPMVRPGKYNRIAILAQNDDHWFYINDICVGHRRIERLPHSRLDVGVVAHNHRQVVCQFQKFTVMIPPIPGLPSNKVS